MKKIERQIEQIADKDQLHRLIDEMPEGSCAVLIVTQYERDFAKHRTFGSPPNERIVWMLEDLKHIIFARAPEVGETNDDDTSANT